MSSIAYGIALPAARGVLTPPAFPAWLPLIGGALAPSCYADFANGRYWCNGAQWLTGEDAAGYFTAAGYAFARASAGSRIRADGRLETVGDGVLRFDHDAASAAALGIRVEGQRTNLVKQSSSFASGWSAENATLGAAGPGPDGVTPVPLVVPNAANTNHDCYQPVAVTAQSYAQSVFAAPAGNSWLNISFGNASQGAWLNVASGALGTVTAGLTAIATAYRNGWCRFAIAKSIAAGTNYMQPLVAAADAGIFFSGDGVSGLRIGFAQFEAGAFPSSYIPTTTAAATRAADVIVRPIVASAASTRLLSGRTPYGVAAEQIRWSCDDGTAANRIRVAYESDGHLHVVVTAGGVDRADLDLGAIAGNTDFRIALSVGTSGVAASRDGGAVVGSGAGTMPPGLVNDRIGGGLAAGTEWFSTCAVDADWRDIAATDAALRALSA